MVRTNTWRLIALVPAAALATAGIVRAATTSAHAAPQSTAVCNPAYKYCDPGRLPAWVYTTRYVLHGMRVNVPGSGWVSHHDSTTEFKLSPPGYSGPTTGSVGPPEIRVTVQRFARPVVPAGAHPDDSPSCRPAVILER